MPVPGKPVTILALTVHFKTLLVAERKVGWREVGHFSCALSLPTDINKI